MAVNSSEYSRTYTTFSGCDILAVFTAPPSNFGGEQITAHIGELQGISYSITREKAPIYTYDENLACVA